MELILERKFHNKDSTEGNLYVNGKWFCNTIEDKVRAEPGKWTKKVKIWGKTAIPYGRYPVLVTWSNKFKRQLTAILNVPDFDGIRMHNGTSEASSAGCVILSYKDDDANHRLINDKGAMNDLCEMIEKVQKTEKVWISIVNKKEDAVVTTPIVNIAKEIAAVPTTIASLGVSKYLTDNDLRLMAQEADFEYEALKSVISVESRGHGFDSVTGKILIQFEPSWFKRKFADWEKYCVGHVWDENKIDVQVQEWLAFNDAFRINADAAMEATAIGIMQVMGFNYADLGFSTVGEMWDFAKESEANQVALAIRFIKNNAKLDQALRDKDWNTFEYYYNGEKAEGKYALKLTTTYSQLKT